MTISKDIQDKFAAEAASVPADGLTPFERAQLAILERQAATKTPTKKAGKQYGARHVIGIIGAVVFIAWALQPSAETKAAKRRDAAAAATASATECNRYRGAILKALPPLNGEVAVTIECSPNRVTTTVQGAARTQPHAEDVLGQIVRGTVEHGVNAAKESKSLSLYIQANAKTATGAAGIRPLTAAMFDPFTDHVRDTTESWLDTVGAL
jgi:type II secretory pathway pseudopilin PulG